MACDLLAARGVGAERAISDAAAYRRIPALPTINALIVEVNADTRMCGFDLARFAREVIPDIRVFYLAGEADRASLAGYAVTGGEFLRRPGSAAELVDALARALPLDPV
jgi:hypothetical protein